MLSAVKQKLLDDDRRDCLADAKLLQNKSFYMEREWPRSGGPKRKYYHRVDDNGHDLLFTPPNLQQCGGVSSGGGDSVDVNVKNGWRRIYDGEELISLVDKIQNKIRGAYEQPKKKA